MDDPLHEYATSGPLGDPPQEQEDPGGTPLTAEQQDGLVQLRRALRGPAERLARGLDCEAEDLLSEVMLRFLRTSCLRDSERYPVEAWPGMGPRILRQIVFGILDKKAARHKHHPICVQPVLDAAAPEVQGLEEQEVLRAQLLAVRQAIQRLTTRQRALAECLLRGMTNIEIAEELGMSPGNVGVAKHRIVRALRESPELKGLTAGSLFDLLLIERVRVRASGPAASDGDAGSCGDEPTPVGTQPKAQVASGGAKVTVTALAALGLLTTTVALVAHFWGAPTTVSGSRGQFGGAAGSVSAVPTRVTPDAPAQVGALPSAPVVAVNSPAAPRALRRAVRPPAQTGMGRFALTCRLVHDLVEIELPAGGAPSLPGDPGLCFMARWADETPAPGETHMRIGRTRLQGIPLRPPSGADRVARVEVFATRDRMFQGALARPLVSALVSEGGEQVIHGIVPIAEAYGVPRLPPLDPGPRVALRLVAIECIRRPGGLPDGRRLVIGAVLSCQGLSGAVVLERRLRTLATGERSSPDLIVFDRELPPGHEAILLVTLAVEGAGAREEVPFVPACWSGLVRENLLQQALLRTRGATPELRPLLLAGVALREQDGDVLARVDVLERSARTGQEVVVDAPRSLHAVGVWPSANGQDDGELALVFQVERLEYRPDEVISAPRHDATLTLRVDLPHDYPTRSLRARGLGVDGAALWEAECADRAVRVEVATGQQTIELDLPEGFRARDWSGPVCTAQDSTRATFEVAAGESVVDVVVEPPVSPSLTVDVVAPGYPAETIGVALVDAGGFTGESFEDSCEEARVALTKRQAPRGGVVTVELELAAGFVVTCWWPAPVHQGPGWATFAIDGSIDLLPVIAEVAARRE